MVKRYTHITQLMICLFILLCITISAQQFKATIDKSTVGQNERFQVYFEFSGGDYNKVKNFRAPSFKGLKVLSGPNQSSNMQIINGQMSASITYSYILIGSDIGTFTIDPASIYYENKVFSSKTLQVKVSKATGSVTKGNTTGGISNEELAKNVFIRASANKTNVYLGEQITVTYKLYKKVNISSPQINKLPTYNGFWAEDLDGSNNINFKVEMYKGERYQAAVIKRVALFPSRSGNLSITPFELSVPVIIRSQRSSRDIFDNFFNDSFFGRSETIDFTAKSNSINVNVKELPNNNIPTSFKGAVGNFKFSAQLNKTEVDVNEAVTFKINISGTGNIQLLDLPEIDLPSGFEKYDPKTSESISRKNIISGRKSIEYLAVPRIDGVKNIPPIKFSYFDPAKKKYITKTSPAFTINVKKGEAGYDTPVSGFTKEDVKLLSEDIRFIKTSDFNFRKKGEFSVIQSWFWISLIAPLLILLTVLGVKKRQDKLSGNVQLLKYRKAEKEARSKLKVAKKAIQSGDTTKFYEEISKAVFGYLEDKLKIQKSEFSQEKALNELIAFGVESELVDKVKNISDKCEFARFAPEGQNGEAEKDMYDETIKVIIQLENSLVGKRKNKNGK